MYEGALIEASRRGKDTMKEIPVIGGTGAQVIPVMKTLSASGHFSVGILTRDVNSARTQDNQKDLHAAFRGVYGAWVNTDGFTLGEKKELLYGCRAYEIARHERVQHYVYASTDFALKDANWDERYHWGHNDAKGRVAEYILAQGQTGTMKSSILTTSPYMDMLMDGHFVPREQPDGPFVWADPAKSGKIPLICLDDVGLYALWLFDNLSQSAGMDLMVATDEICFAEIAAIFTKVTGKKGVHYYIPIEDWLNATEPYPNALANFVAGPSAHRDEASMTWRENFGPWWRYWGEGVCKKRGIQLLDRIHPTRVKSLEG